MYKAVLLLFFSLSVSFSYCSTLFAYQTSDTIKIPDTVVCYAQRDLQGNAKPDCLTTFIVRVWI